MKKLAVVMVIVFLLPNLFPIATSAQMTLPEKEFVVKEKAKEQDKIIKDKERKKKEIYYKSEEDRQVTINNSVVPPYNPAASQKIEVKVNNK